MPGRECGMQASQVMTIEELAEYLKVSKSSLYKLAQQGRVPGQKVGKHWRFSKGAVDRWLEKNEETDTNTDGDA